jgi:hypothetical protein
MASTLVLPFRNIKKSFQPRIEHEKHPQIPQIHADEFAQNNLRKSAQSADKKIRVSYVFNPWQK